MCAAVATADAARRTNSADGVGERPRRVRAVPSLPALDRRLLVFARTRGHGPRRERAAAAYSRLGEHAACWLVLGAAGAAGDGQRRDRWLRGAGVVGVAYGANYAVKLLVRRRRPTLAGLPALSP